MKTIAAASWLVAGLLTLAEIAHAAEPYKIDVILPLTGGGAFLGRAEQISLQQAEKMFAKGEGIGGRPVQFVFHDDQSSPQTAVQLATQIVAARPAVVLGSAIVAMCNAMAPLMKNGPVMYCFSPGIYPAAGGYVFTSSSATRDLIAAQLRYFRMRGLKRIAVITSTDASGQDAQRNIKDLLTQAENKEIELVGETTFNPTDVSASAQIQRLKGHQPQALIAWSTGAAIGTVFKGIVEAGLDIPVATTDGNMTYAQMTQYASFLPKQLYIPAPQWLPDPRNNVSADLPATKRQFFAAFEGSSVQPDAASTFSWDPALIVVAALKKLGPDATAAQLRDHLLHLKGYVGLNGAYDYERNPQRGLDETSVVITRWDADKKTWIAVSKARGIPSE